MQRSSLACLAAVTIAFLPANAAELTFDERVQAQAGIERVYHSHRIDATASFEEAVSRAVIEEKVRTYLRQSVALEELWATPVTKEMLEREVERIARGTRMPERLRELFEALGNDAFLIQECLARPVLVDRLARGFFAGDERIHAEPDEVAWDPWWAEVAGSFDDSRAVVAARPDAARPAVTDTCVPDDTWDNGVLSGLPSPRRHHTIVWTGTEALVWGGFGGVLDGTGSRYDPATDTWIPMSTVDAPSARSSHTAVWTGSAMVVWGGYDGNEVDTGGRYDPVSDTWAPTSMQGAPSARQGHTATWTGSEMIVWGGGTGNLPIPMSTGGRYDPAADTWSPVSMQDAPSARLLHTAVWTGSVMVVWGGRGDGNVTLDTGGRYDPATDAWTPTSTVQSPTARARHSAVWTGSHMIIWGGSRETDGEDPMNRGSRYDPVADTWNSTSTQDPDTPEARHDHVAVWTGSRMFVWGGSTDRYDSAPLDTGGRYDPVTNTWTPTSAVNAPAKRALAEATWTGNLVLVWGGAEPSTYFNTGGRYDPVADVWTPTSTLSAPAARDSHTTVWTGNRMIVWGGEDGNSRFQTGGRYDPALDAWTPSSTIGAPAPRKAHTAVWTGGRVVVWGGTELGFAGPFLATGGRYDPVTDVWTSTATLGAPSARAYHTAVWTGYSMLVWGGYDNDAYFDTGGRYDPVSDTWTAISASSAPPGRAWHTAVWTGSRMIVWGGYDGAWVDTGGRYDPWSDTWTPTSSTNAPTPRALFPAVWTGDRMIVWGGRGHPPLTEFQTGGVYDPASDTWTPTSTANAPFERSHHTAVWTGDRMIVWGGYWSDFEFQITVDTGGRYDPVTDTWTSTSVLDAPSPRLGHSAVWTGRSMIIWGGQRVDVSLRGPFFNQGGRYFAGGSIDQDGDGFAGCEGDCNDADATVFPGAVELCDGLDRDCDGVVSGVDQDGDGACAQTDCNDLDPSLLGVAGEVADVTVEKTQPTTLHFASQDASSGASTSYDVAAGTIADLHATTGFDQGWCVGSFADTPAQDPGPDPVVGQAYYYIVRARNACGTGDWGQGSTGSPRTVTACP